MGTNPGTASYSKRQAKRAGAGGGGAGAGAGAGAVFSNTDNQLNSNFYDGLLTDTDLLNKPNRPESSVAITRQINNDKRAKRYETALGRASEATVSSKLMTLDGLRDTNNNDLKDAIGRLKIHIADVERLVPKARELLAGGEPLSGSSRSSMIRRFNIIDNRMPNMQTNLRRAERELSFRPTLAPRNSLPREPR